jgi:poly(A) polymerase
MDICISGNVNAIASLLAQELGCHWFMLDDARSVSRLIPKGQHPDWQIDLSFYSGNIIDDLGRRDFCINAMAVPLDYFVREDLSGLIDPFHGRADLDSGILRIISPGAFSDDPLRLLRLARFAGEFALSTDPLTHSAALSSAHLIKTIPGERVQLELSHILCLRLSTPAFRLMDTTGVMGALFPLLSEMRRLDASGEHYWNAYEHSLQTLEWFEFLTGMAGSLPSKVNLENREVWFDPLLIELDLPVGSINTRKSLGKLAALLHDIGKPSTFAREESGRIRFLGHAKIGAELVGELLANLRFSKQEMDYVTLLVRHHLRLFQLSNGGLPTGRAIHRFCRDAGQNWREVVLIALADHLATSGPRLENSSWSETTKLVSHVVSERNRQLRLISSGRLLNGNDLKSYFPNISGPDIGRVLADLEEATSIGSVRTRAEALKLASETILRDNSANPISRGDRN